jgi:putative transcriptional regulator
MNEPSYLQNQLLIATPGGNDPYFHKAVIYLCEHTSNGAMGIVINQPMNVSIMDLLKHMELVNKEADPETLSTLFEQLVFAGGPLQRERGFVLHHPAGKWQSSFSPSDEVTITTSRDILQALVDGKEQSDMPEDLIVALGYTGWDAGQLEDEITHNFWLTCPANNQILFHTPIEQRWEAAGRLLGIDLNSFPSLFGHA